MAMIPAMHRRGQNWPTMRRPVPQPIAERRSPIGEIVAWAAFVGLVVVAIVAPVL